MTIEKIISELNKQYDWLDRYQNTRQKKLKMIHKQCKTEEKRIQKKLARQTDKVSRRKLKKKLGTVKKAYMMLKS